MEINKQVQSQMMQMKQKLSLCLIMDPLIPGAAEAEIEVKAEMLQVVVGVKAIQGIHFFVLLFIGLFH